MQYKCKGREKEYYKEWYLKNKEKRRRQTKQYREANKEKMTEQKKQYYLANKEKLLEQTKQYREANKEKLLEYQKQYYLANKEKLLEQTKQYYLENKEYYKQYDKQYRLENKEKIKEYQKEHHKQYYLENKERQKQWVLKNKDKLNGYYNNYQNNKRKTDLKFNLNCKISHLIWLSLKGNKNGRHWESLVDYTKIDLEKHLKSTMPKGYTWNDFLRGELHIDHIIPKSVFNFTKPEDVDFKRCWALKNLQLLPANENLRKSNKLYKPFQPALKIMVS